MKTEGMSGLIPQQCRVGGGETEAQRDGGEETGLEQAWKDGQIEEVCAASCTRLKWGKNSGPRTFQSEAL